ncbi:nucleotidyltransferase family protein [Streptomyces siamensis]|uniref:Nucleotidyltransferase domain-containing protein n=1 Tax=Streptomyces siamensis TaxID=1274986 RepID=A0ABP9J2T0_9ACTN
MTVISSVRDRVRLGRSIASRLAASADADAAFVAGSSVVGLGSATSDIDVYLVGSSAGETRRQMFADTTRIDVQHLRLDTLESLVDRVLGRGLRSDHAGQPLSDREIALVVRLRTGDIVTDSGALAALRERLDEHPLRLARLVMNNWMLAAFFAAEDCLGLSRSEDPNDLDPAVLAGRRALVCAGKALAAAGGDLYFGEKWVWRQLARSGPDGFPFEDFQRLLRDDPLAVDPQAGLTALTSFAQTCLIATATLGWQGADVSHWPVWRQGSGPLHRSPAFFPRAYDDMVTLIEPAGRHFRLPPRSALVWGLSHGLSSQTATEYALNLSKVAPAFAALTEQRCRGITTELREAGLLTEQDGQRGAM